MIKKIFIINLCLIQSLFAYSSLSETKQINLNAHINITTNSSFEFTIYFRNFECYKCSLIKIYDNIDKFSNYSTELDTFYPGYYLFIQNNANKQFYCDNLSNKVFIFNEQSEYLLKISNISNNLLCSIITLNDAGSIYLSIYIAIGIFVGAALFYISFKYLYKIYKKKNIANELDVPLTSSYLIEEPSLNSNPIVAQQEKKRMKSVDVFRGFSLVIVIFANYGAGGYSSLDHAVWNGLNLADCVFPCFIFILGISIPLSFKSISIKASKTDWSKMKKSKNLIYKILKRSFLLFFFGLVTSNSDYSLDEIRIMGVLQRFAFSYLVCAFIEMIYLVMDDFIYLGSIDSYLNLQEPSNFLRIKNQFKDIIYYPFQWLIIIFIAVAWVLFTFFLQVENCSPGYLGPGGLSENGTHFNCTGGAANYIDRIILGNKHLYQNPTSKIIYKHLLPHDPEGLLGILTSICLAYFGVQCGHILIHYEEPYKRIIRFVSNSLFYGLFGAILCQFSKDDGIIPVNKNLWSLSFILVMAGIAYFILTVFYIIIDVFDIYSGTPFLYFGRNSITIYICHSIFQNNFPFFQVENTHPWLLGIDLYGICFWFIIAFLMDSKKIYINL